MALRRAGAFVCIGLLAAMQLMPSAHATERVQLASFLVPAMPDPVSNSRRAVISIYVDVPDLEQGEYVCAVSPRLFNAITQAAHSRPLARKADGKLDLARVQRALAPLINSNVKPVVPTSIYIVEGTREVTGDLAPVFRAKGCVVRTDLTKKRNAATADGKK